jgi:predicted RND superfamily exporter protein
VDHKKLSDIFEQISTFILRWRWLILGTFGVLILFASFGLKKLDIVYSNHHMFLASDSIMIKSEEFREVFGNDMFIGVLVNNDSLFSKEQLEKIEHLAQSLQDSVPFVESVSAITNLYFPESVGGKVQLAKVIPDKIPASKDSLDLLKSSFLERHIVFNRILSSDATSSWITLRLQRFDPEEHAASEVKPEIQIGQKVFEIISDPHYHSLQPKASGIPYINYMEKHYFSRESRKIILFALIMASIILIVLTRSFLGVLSPFIITLASLVLVFGMGGWFGMGVAGLVISLPILLSLAVSIAYTIHVQTFYKRYRRQGFRSKRAIIKALSSIGWPMLFTSLTTFFALLTILFIKVPAIREIGVISAFCVLVVFITTFLLLPVLLSLQNRKYKTEGRLLVKSIKSDLEDRYLNLVLGHQRTIFAITFILVILGVIGITRIEATFDLKGSVGEDVPYIHEWLKVANSELGSLYSYDMEVKFNGDENILTSGNLEKLEKLTERIYEIDKTKNVTSVLNLIKGFNYIIHDFDRDSYAIPSTKGEIDIIYFLIKNFGLNQLSNWVDASNQKVRIIREIESYDSKSLKDNNLEIKEIAHSLFEDIEISMVGTVPQFAKVNQYVVKGQVFSFAAAILIILILIIMVFGSVRVGLIALIPNVVPVIFVGGIMGYFNIPLDMMTVTIIPIMIGLGVDDTIHLFSHFEKEFDKSRNYYHSIKRSIHKVGPALIYTTIILSANFLIYLLSDAKIFMHTGLLTTIGLVTALLADLILAPILFRRFSIFGKERG